MEKKLKETVMIIKIFLEWLVSASLLFSFFVIIKKNYTYKSLLLIFKFLEIMLFLDNK